MKITPLKTKSSASRRSEADPKSEDKVEQEYLRWKQAQRASESKPTTTPAVADPSASFPMTTTNEKQEFDDVDEGYEEEKPRESLRSYTGPLNSTVKSARGVNLEAQNRVTEDIKNQA
mmetsp:Transcript_21245/g.32911  ORF Transcript_21245/g.32911 Transcript_21245/m.32911 type:complete len:118 (+) Transcript_21245:1367-1720(+)|eukprot:CAMPEP_0170512512 /NCGR_PEP_ID=MMETSP0208-20121228/66890_1 /TAXON_ID=197538 /ORGANISM="Strombidium inclinatum, Strain S3" /LENGTH=117 /DNA_ID=CAMNT_0010796151 /DNA_START=1313 /DNA_END=1666 /DNA_ORIENTATION=-